MYSDDPLLTFISGNSIWCRIVNSALIVLVSLTNFINRRNGIFVIILDKKFMSSDYYRYNPLIILILIIMLYLLEFLLTTVIYVDLTYNIVIIFS